MRKIKLLFTLFTLLLVSSNVAATDYYVSLSGNDNNNGSAGSPWRTLSKACSTVSANQNHTINIGSGTFNEGGIITIPSGVNVVGAGSGSTILKINYYYNAGAVNPHSQTFPEKFVIQMNGSNQTIKGFALDGQNQCHGGIFARYMTNTVFDDLFIYNFKYCGLWIPETYNVEVKNCHLKDNAYGNTTHGDSGNLQFHDGDGFSVHDCIIEEVGAINGNMGGYGMKAQWMTWDGGGDLFHELRNLTIYNNTITVPEVGSWNNGQSPAIVIEFLTLNPNGMVIRNNNFNNSISIPHSDGLNSTFPCGRIQNNNFQLGINRYAYAIEAGANGIEIDHNLFDGGIYPIASFGEHPHDQTIHHNVFINQRVDRSVVQHSNALNGFRFYNNTIVDTQGIGEIFESWFAPIVLNGPDLRNNIFTSTVGVRGNILNATITGGTFTKNCFYNITPQGSSNVTSNPLLNLSGIKPSPFFQLQSGSPCINAGVAIPGITDGYAGAAPDMGAFEYGATPWEVGPTSTVSVPVTSVAMSPTTASINTGTTTQLSATVAPANATNKIVAWITSNASVATVSASGLVSGIAPGTATVTVTTQDGGKTATCTVTVSAAGSATVYEAETGTFGGGSQIQSASNASNGQLIGNMNNVGSYTQVSSINGGSGGAATLVIRYANGFSSNSLVSLYVNGTDVAQITFVPTGGWNTFNNVTQTITLSSGTANTIRLQKDASDISASDIDKYTVTPSAGSIPVTSVSISPTTASINVGSTTQLSATVIPTNATNKAISWTSSNTNVATVSNSGLVTGVAAGTSTITVTTQDGSKTATCSITVTALSSCAGVGSILLERYEGITGVAVSNLTSAAKYPNSPDHTAAPTSFEAATDILDNYGLRMRGFICPPSTGLYTFWIAGDDNTELWLSTDNNAVNKVKIAYHNAWTATREWNKFATQKSASVTLQAGTQYYIEALMKEGAGGDNLAVGWAKPGQATTSPSEVIPGTSLIPSTITVVPSELVLQAEAYNTMSGIVNKGTVIGNYGNGDWVAFSSVNLSTGFATLSASVACDAANSGHTIQARLGSPTGTLIGTLTVPNTGGWTSFQTISTTLTGGTGINTVYFVGVSNTNDVGDCDWFKFSQTNGSSGGRLASTSREIQSVEVNEVSEDLLQIYPVPVMGDFNIEMNGFKNPEVTILDMMGKVVFTKKVISDNNRLLISQRFPKGVYIVFVNDAVKKKFKKIVIE